jgi:hypothetical protein
MARSNAFRLARLLGPDTTIQADKIAADAVGGSVTSYATAAALPLSGNTTGDQAFVSETGRLYIFTGAGWYNIALINTNPNISSGANASYSLNIDGTPTVITLVANDPEGIPITWSYAVTSGSLTNGGGTSATVTQVDNEFTITPSTNQTYEGVFDITFTASDGVNLATSASTFSLIWYIPPSTVEYLAVAGGGGGSAGGGGGGGAGGLKLGAGSVSANTSYTIVVGDGGAGGVQLNEQGFEGGGSSISGTGLNIDVTGGGGGGGPNGAAAVTGGSGGGAARYSLAVGAGIANQGNAGGSTSGNDSSAGGGGAGGAGQNKVSVSTSGAGGIGVQSSITGTATYYAGGGGGSGASELGATIPGAGGLGGGGSGGAFSGTGIGISGTAYTGGGGGAGSYSTGSNPGGQGGSGVVILRYADSYSAAASTTGSPTITVAGGYRIYKFTQSGTITF